MRCDQSCKIMTRFLADARLAGFLVALVSFGALAGAYFFQYVVGLSPCPLCLYQRIPHAIIIVLGIAVFCMAAKPKLSALLLVPVSMFYMAGATIAFYHAGVEQHWWASFLEACTAQIDSASVDNLLQHIEQTKAVRCDSVPWQMFGISMAGYNAILSLAMAVYALIAAIVITRRSNGF